MRRLFGAAMLAVLLPSPAAARDLCAERPGLGTPACTVEPGHLQVETGLADWTRERGDGERIDTIQFAFTELRFGIGEATELQLAWTPYGHQRLRDAAGGVDRVGRVGDVRLAVKQNLANPDGHGLSVALLPFATLPVGRQPIGAGDWGAGLVAPVTWDLSDAVQLEFTPEVDAAVDEDGRGRHLAYSGVAGVEWDPAEGIEFTAEVQALRDRDPAGRTTSWLAGLSAGWQPNHHLQFDIGAAAGLDHDAPGLRVYGGLVTLF